MGVCMYTPALMAETGGRPGCAVCGIVPACPTTRYDLHTPYKYITNPHTQSLQRIALAHAATVLPAEGEGELEPPSHIVHWEPEGLDKGLPRRLLRR